MFGWILNLLLRRIGLRIQFLEAREQLLELDRTIAGFIPINDKPLLSDGAVSLWLAGGSARGLRQCCAWAIHQRLTGSLSDWALSCLSGGRFYPRQFGCSKTGNLFLLSVRLKAKSTGITFGAPAALCEFVWIALGLTAWRSRDQRSPIPPFQE